MSAMTRGGSIVDRASDRGSGTRDDQTPGGADEGDRTHRAGRSGAPLRLAIVAYEPPYPARHGWRADVWRRMLALQEQGVELMLIYWASDIPAERPTPEEEAVMRGVATRLYWCEVEQSPLRRAARLVRRLSQHAIVVSRELDRAAQQRLGAAVAEFGADAIWLEGAYAGRVAQDLARDLQRPLFVRSHNIEHLYAARQGHKAGSWSERLKWAGQIGALRRLETRTLAAASAFFDISVDDLAWWSSRGLARGHWLPPIIDEGQARRLAAPPVPGERTHDVGYLGNLATPNNVEGVLWFLAEIVPRLRAVRADLKVFIAGSTPRSAIVVACQKAAVDLIQNATDAVSVQRRAKVLVNPVFFGSGVNVKSVDMLLSGAHLVSTPQGLAGFPPMVKAEFAVAADAERFSDAILARLAGPDEVVASPSREHARALFGPASVVDALSVVRQFVRPR